jgi:hypothetical protein
VGSEEEVVQLIMETEEGPLPDVINDQHQLDPDIRPVRNIWTKWNPQERVKNAKFMCERFGMLVEIPNCACCRVIETPWRVVGNADMQRR